MSVQKLGKPGEDIVARFAKKARYVVHLEMAYDVVDELASSPERYLESMYKLSRLATKVLNDVQKRLDRMGQGDRGKPPLDSVKRSLESWAPVQEEFIRYLQSLDKEALRSEVKRFAALAVAPSRRVSEAKEELTKKEE